MTRSNSYTAKDMTLERIAEWRKVYSMHLNHEVPQLRQAAMEQLALCDLAELAIRLDATSSEEK
jgi:hypothetical protein